MPEHPKGIIDGEELYLGAIEFEQLVGHFMLAWADTEMRCFEVLLHYAGVTRPVGRALFSGTRAKGMLAFVDAIQANTGTDPKKVADFKFIRDQISAVNDLRDTIAHHGSSAATPSRDTPYSRRIFKNRRGSRVGSEVTIELLNDELRAVISDLDRIRVLLSNHTRVPFRRIPGSGEASTWLYKSPQPEPHRGRTPENPAAPKRPPKPSGG